LEQGTGMTSSWKTQAINNTHQYLTLSYDMVFLKIQIVFIYFLFVAAGFGQSPHGEKFTIDCAQCHAPENWSYAATKGGFNHDKTAFPLQGQHRNIECRSCHSNLVFEEVKATCFSCHEDVHAQSVGNDCARCHTPNSWVVENITNLHEMTSFPLVGNHSTIDCALCHENQTTLRFGPLPLDCNGCHNADYLNASQPNHVKEHYPTSCESCHSVVSIGWTSTGVNHQFFPLEEGHSNLSCTQCHKPDTYSGLSPDCFQCHQQDYLTAKNPGHQGFPQKCTECHTLAVGWKPARFDNHDNFFPIFTGNHKGAWNDCTDCHTNPSNLNVFSCIDCHEHNDANDLAEEHDDVKDYRFDSNACYQCHPKGR
jgi:hypothetical protein